MNTLVLRICIAGMAVTFRWRRALWQRDRYRAAYRIGRIGDRMFARRPCLCTCTPCRAAGITAPVALRAAGFVDLHRRPRPASVGAR